MRGAAPEALECDVAVVGLGPVGAMLCNLLAVSGLDVVAFDREPATLQLPRAVGIDGEMMRMVQTVGLADKLLPFLKVFRGAQYLDAEGNVVSTRPGITGPGPQGWPNRFNVHQPELEEVLRGGLAASPHVDFRPGHEVLAVRDGEETATVQARNLETGADVEVRARFVVGCDGGRSLVRRSADIELEDFGLNQPWIVADFRINETADLPGINTHFADPRQPVIYIHVVRDLRRFEFRPLPDEDLAAAVEPDALWTRASRWIHPGQAELLRAAVYTHRSLVAREWRKGRLLLAGDAAHQTPPFLGQGLCTGLRDVASLAWRLGAIIHRGAPLELLDSYESERSEHARFFIKTATQLGSVLTAPSRDSLDALNGRVGREGQGKPPRLGPGLYCEEQVGGLLAPQPRLAGGALLDDVVGYRSVVVATATLMQAMPPALAELLGQADIALVEATGEAEGWLADLSCQAVLVRPDRYYFGRFDSVDELARSVERLVGQTVPGARKGHDHVH